MIEVQLDDKGLVPAVAQNSATGEVLMLGYMNPGSIKRTMESGEVWFYSRSRSDLWHKGEISGNYMRVKSAKLDCDGDAILLQVEPEGPVCHTAEPSCFFTSLDSVPEYKVAKPGPGIMEDIFSVIQERRDELPGDSYTTELLEAGLKRISQKVVEEAGEAAIAGATGDTENLVDEVADLMFHTLVLVAASGLNLGLLWDELSSRRG